MAGAAMTGLLFTAAAFTLVGAAVRRLAGGGPRFLLGVGTTGLVLYVALLMHLPLLPVLILIGIAAVITLVVARSRVSEPEPPRSVAAAVVTVAPVVLLLFITALVPLNDYDGRAFWVLKAKAIANEGAIDGPYFSGERHHNPKNEYPLLVPLAAGAVMRATGSLDEFGIRWLYVLALASLALHARRWIGAWPAALIVWIPEFALHSAQAAYNDIFVAAFGALAFFELADRTSPLRFGLWISFLALTKNEGLPFALILLLIAAATWKRGVLRSLPPFAIALTTLFAWRLRVEPTDDDPLIRLLPTLPQRLERLVPAVTEFGARAFQFERWGFFWYAVATAAVVLVVRRRWRELLPAAVVIAGMYAVYVAAYMVTTWQLIDHVNASADRLWLHFVGPGLWLMAIAARTSREREVDA
jgi:hypothetical protein